MCPSKKVPPNAGKPQPSQTTKAAGDVAESEALQRLLNAGLTLLQRNYRTPGRGGGEIDLIMRETDGTVVFVEVRARQTADYGGAASSVTPRKQRRIIWAARRYLQRWLQLPPCRFDVLAREGGEWHWLKGAFDAGF
ncbi:MAG: YraN family protein [Burkholderiaceae bacterium]|nr:YraN family protein [Burkholderiaceae bacterium]